MNGIMLLQHSQGLRRRRRSSCTWIPPNPAGWSCSFVYELFRKHHLDAGVPHLGHQQIFLIVLSDSLDESDEKIDEAPL